MFAILVASMYEDCQDNILLNYLTTKIFYADNYTQDKISDYLNKSGVTNMTILNNMWFDSNYGFRNILGLQTWIKVAYLRK